ncbi:MAG: hypothetical protein WKG06_26355 [Segetibacter sp.]
MQRKTGGTLLILFALFLCLGAGKTMRQVRSHLRTTIDTVKEKKALMDLIEKENVAFYNKDLPQVSECWSHSSYIRHMGWWKRGGIRVVSGWDSLHTNFQELFAKNPAQNQQKTVRKNFNFRIADNMAWCTFDEYGQDNKEPDMDLPGLIRNTRIFEKQNGEWKIVYVGFLLNG